MTTERDRVISITLSEAEWRAFVTRHPQPVDWLRERIRSEVQKATSESAADRQAALYGRRIARWKQPQRPRRPLSARQWPVIDL